MPASLTSYAKPSPEELLQQPVVVSVTPFACMQPRLLALARVA